MSELEMENDKLRATLNGQPGYLELEKEIDLLRGCLAEQKSASEWRNIYKLLEVKTLKLQRQNLELRAGLERVKEMYALLWLEKHGHLDRLRKDLAEAKDNSK